MDIQGIRKSLLEYWSVGVSESEVTAYTRILDHILTEPCSNLEHLAFSSFVRIVNDSDVSREVLLKLVFHLINVAHLLDLKYEYIDDDEACFPLSNENIRSAKLLGYLLHPETGEEIYDYSENVFMYFVPAQKLRDIKEQPSSSLGESR